MRLRRSIHDPTWSRSTARRKERGLSLPEMVVTLGVGSIVLVILGLLSYSGLRSFLVMGNCTALDDQSRRAADQITRELRQATRVLRYEADTDSRRLVLTNSVQGLSVEYTWSVDTRTVTCQKTDQSPFVCLTECDAWDAAFFQGIPQAGGTHSFLPATNGLGEVNPGLARVVNLSWKCSRPVTGSEIRTESAQALQIVLRNAAQP